MKDIVENRARINLSEKVRVALTVVKENGIAWTALIRSGVANFAFKKAQEFRTRYNLPGLNSPSANEMIWNSWGKGDEWTPSSEWKRSVVRTFIDPNVADGATVLEIGPGRGRWTEYLIKKAGRLIAIDISEACILECMQRFAGSGKATFFVGSGTDLRQVESQSIDAIWSFDVFVHINKEQFNSYVGEFQRVLKAGGIGIVHHGGSGGNDGGWRSNVTCDDVRTFMVSNGLTIECEIQSWIDGGKQFDAGLYKDFITVVRKVDSA